MFAFPEEVRLSDSHPNAASDGVTTKLFVMCANEVEQLRELSSNGSHLSSQYSSNMSNPSASSPMSSFPVV